VRVTTLNIVDLDCGFPVPRDGHDRPLVVPKAGGKPVAHTRTTSFIDCIEDKSNLADWGKRQVLLGCYAQPSILNAVEGLDPTDPDDKKKLNALAEAAMEKAGAHEKREKGTELHGFSEYTDAGLVLPESASEADRADMAAYMMATIDFTMVDVEQFCVVNLLCCAGTYDRSLRYTGPGPLPGMYFEDELLMGDLKTGGSAEYGALKMASQLAVYSRAEKYDHTLFPIPPLTARMKPSDDPVKDYKRRLDIFKKTVFTAEEAEKAYSSLGPINQEWGVIIHLPSGSGDATLYWADLTLGWEAAQEALTIRSLRSRGKRALIPFESAAIKGAVLSG
jgi:hypothetical protein